MQFVNIDAVGERRSDTEYRAFFSWKNDAGTVIPSGICEVNFELLGEDYSQVLTVSDEPDSDESGVFLIEDTVTLQVRFSTDAVELLEEKSCEYFMSIIAEDQETLAIVYGNLSAVDLRDRDASS